MQTRAGATVPRQNLMVHLSASLPQAFRFSNGKAAEEVVKALRVYCNFTKVELDLLDGQLRAEGWVDGLHGYVAHQTELAMTAAYPMESVASAGLPGLGKRP